MSRPGEKKSQRRNPRGTRQLNVDVLESLRAMADADTRVTGQHNMRARLVSLNLEALDAIRPRERQTLALRLVHRGEDETARQINADLWPVAAMRGLDALPERSRALLMHALGHDETRQALIAWLEGLSGGQPAAGGGAPPPPPASPGAARSSSRSRKGTGKRKGR